jgi:hypothetical protein
MTPRDADMRSAQPAETPLNCGPRSQRWLHRSRLSSPPSRSTPPAELSGNTTWARRRSEDAQFAYPAAMPSDEITSPIDPWLAVRAQLRALDPLLDVQPVNALAVAKQFESLAAAMRSAMESDGQTSTRFRAVTKALDLRTPKSKLVAFVRED